MKGAMIFFFRPTVNLFYRGEPVQMSLFHRKLKFSRGPIFFSKGREGGGANPLSPLPHPLELCMFFTLSHLESSFDYPQTVCLS